MKRIYIALLICLCVIKVQAQTIAGCEYWFDNHFDGRIAQNTASGSVLIENEITDFSPGLHLFNFRLKNSEGLWSSPTSCYFLKPDLTTRNENQLTRYEYWLDNQFDTRQSANVIPENSVVQIEQDCSSLPQGMHTFNFRGQDKYGAWSSMVSYYFLKPEITEHSDNQLTAYEYWLNDDYLNKVTGKLNGDGIINLESLDVSFLKEGCHFINFRIQDALGKWSSTVSYYFFRLVRSIPENNNIIQYKYCFNNDSKTLQVVDIDPTNPLEWNEKIFEIPEMDLVNVPDSFGLSINKDQTLSISVPTESQFALSFKDATETWCQPIVETFEYVNRKTTTATILESNRKLSISKPETGRYVALTITVSGANSIYWKTDQPCSISLFTPDGKWLTCLNGANLMEGKKIEVTQQGTYYAFVHTAIKNDSYPSESLSLIGIVSSQNENITVEVAGTLPELVDDPDAVVNLTLTGYLNGTDIKFIRSLKNLQRLDIGGARIVEGGDKYYENYLTADDIIGDYMFYNLPNLTRLVLSNHTTEIAASALNSCAGLTEIDIPASVTSVGNSVFNACTQLLLINWNAQAPITTESFDIPANMGNLLVIAPEGTGCTYKGNVIIGGIAEKITLTHGKGLRSPQPFKAKDITYKRNFNMHSGNKTNAAGWEAIVLPFDVQTFSNEEKGELAPFNSGKEGVKPFWLAQMTTDGFEHTTAMKANTPYIISMPNSDSYESEFNISGEVLFHAENPEGVDVKATSGKELIRLEGSNRTMAPAYETVFKHDTVYAINLATYENIAPGGAFVRNSRDVQPFEAYLISKEAVTNAPKLYSIGGVGGEITGIGQVPSDTFEGIEIYAQHGTLYIKSDRERIISIFDTTGRTVRQVEVHEGTTTVAGLAKGIYLLARKKILIQ